MTERFEAVAYRRFRWNTPPEAGDIERILTYTGFSILNRGKLCAVYCYDKHQPIAGKLVVYPIATPSRELKVYPAEIVSVAPARVLLDKMLSTLAEAEQTLSAQAIIARIILLIKTQSGISDPIELQSRILSGTIPVLPLTSELDASDIIRIGDGETHAASTRELMNVALSLLCQSLGVHYSDSYKRERNVASEVEGAHDAVEIVRLNELHERQRLSAITGWEVTEN